LEVVFSIPPQKYTIVWNQWNSVVDFGVKLFILRVGFHVDGLDNDYECCVGNLNFIVQQSHRYKMFKLDTPRLLLRDMQFDDEASFVAISQDDKYQRFYNEDDCHPDKYRQLTKLFIDQSHEVPRKAFQLAIEHKSSGKFIGTVCLRLESDHQASIGFGVSRLYQGKGLTREAAKALVSFGFAELGIHRLYAETIRGNVAAVRLCQSLGMRQEAIFREHRFFKGQWWDTVVLAILHSEWSQLH